MVKFFKNDGFTLIELLVVIAIIGILASIALVAFRSSQAKARNIRRVSDLNSIAKALELYYDDHGKYPAMTSSPAYPGSSFLKIQDNLNVEGDWGELGAALSPYLSPIPTPALGANTQRRYYYYTTGAGTLCLGNYAGNVLLGANQQSFALYASLEDDYLLSEQDGGTIHELYERYGGKYEIHGC